MGKKLKRFMGILLGLMLLLGQMSRMSLMTNAADQYEEFTTPNYNGVVRYNGENIKIYGDYGAPAGAEINKDDYAISIEALNGATISRIEMTIGENPQNAQYTTVTEGIFNLNNANNEGDTVKIENVNAASVTITLGIPYDYMMYKTFRVYYVPATNHTVTYKVINGTWSDGTTADKTETVVNGSNPGHVPAGMIASSGYSGGSWDTVPSSATITGPTTFTYTFTGGTGVEIPSSVEGSPNGSTGHHHHKCEDGHRFSYNVCREPSTEIDGFATWCCERCGIKDPAHADDLNSDGFIILSAYPVFNDKLESDIKNAGAGATVSISTKRWVSVRRAVLEGLAARPDVTLSVSYVSGGADCTLTLKGDDPKLAEILAKQDSFFGFNYMNGIINAR